MISATDNISVIICAYTEDRWDDLVASVESVQRQTLPPREIILVIDHNPSLLKRVREEVPGVVVVENSEAQGLRGARNSGIARARGQIIAFLDDDAVAVQDWLMFLSQGYTNPHVLGTGGGVRPLWVDKKPAWLPEEFYWVIGCDYRGMPQTSAPIRNPFGANMSIRRDVFDTVGDFHTGIVRVGPRHAGGSEDVEWCIRARQCSPQGIFLYQPEALVFHRVPANRASLRYFYRRCYIEGLAKASMVRYVGAKDGLSSERAYTLRTLPRGVLRGLADALFRCDLAGLARASVIVAALTATTAGYLVGSAMLRLAKSRGINAPDGALQVTEPQNTLVTEEVLQRNAEIPLPLESQH